MIEIFVNIRFVLLWSILAAILLTIFFGIKNYISNDPKKFQTQLILSGISIFTIPIFILLYNAFLSNLILNDIVNKVKLETTNNTSIHINGIKSEITIQDVEKLVTNTNFWNTRNHTHDLEGYLITINRDIEPYEFSFFRDSGDKTKFHLYINEYNYELELAQTKTDIFD